MDPETHQDNQHRLRAEAGPCLDPLHISPDDIHHAQFNISSVTLFPVLLFNSTVSYFCAIQLQLMKAHEPKHSVSMFCFDATISPIIFKQVKST